MVDRWQQNGLYFAATQTERVTNFQWLVWCSFEPVVADDPIGERFEQEIWFKFSATKEGAIEYLLKEVG